MKNIIFSLGTLLAIEKEKRNLFLLKISKFAKEKDIPLYLSTSLKEDVGREDVDKNNLFNFFLKENIFYVNEIYLSSLSSEDKDIRDKGYEKDKRYLDSYHKVYLINSLNLNSKDTLFIGNDLLLDAYYLKRFTNVSIVLLDQAITYNGKKEDKVINFNFIMSLDNLENVILNNVFDIDNLDYSSLDGLIKNRMYRELVGMVDLSGVDLSKLKKNN